MPDIGTLSFNPDLLRYWLHAFLACEKTRKPRLWIDHDNTSFKRDDLRTVLPKLMSHFPPNTFRLEPGRVVGGVCLEAPSLVIDTSDYRFSVRPAYTDQHGVKWLGALVFEFTPAHRKFRKADIKFSVRFDEKGSSRKPCLEVTDALDKLNNPTEADMASLDALQELVKLLQDNGQYRVMLNQLYDLATECYKATDEKPRGWHRLRILLNKAD